MADLADIHTAFCADCGADYKVGADGDAVYIGCQCAFDAADAFLAELRDDLPLETVEDDAPDRGVGRSYQ